MYERPRTLEIRIRVSEHTRHRWQRLVKLEHAAGHGSRRAPVGDVFERLVDRGLQRLRREQNRKGRSLDDLLPAPKEDDTGETFRGVGRPQVDS